MRNFQKPGRSEVYAQNGMIATSHPLAAKIGLDIMSRGGNAIDAAISAALMLVLCEPQSTGLFGDAFAIFKTNTSDKLIGMNGSGRSPSRLSSDLLINAGEKEIPTNSVHSITMPGAVALFEELATKHGNLGLSELCLDPIKYAEQGVVVSPRVSFDWQLGSHKFSDTAKKYYLINGKVPHPGAVFRAPGQAKVLRQIAKNGAKGFYQSEITEDFVSSLEKLGGMHQIQDFSNVKVEYVNPISLNLEAGHELFELPPNGQGITAMMMKKLMEICNIKQFPPGSFERVHLETEIAKLAYSSRDRLIGDPEFSEINYKLFLDEAFLSDLAKRISMKKLIKDEPSNNPFEKSKDTVLITAADKEGNSISLIFSIFDSFGSGMCSERFGLIFHNRGAGFVLTEGHPNQLKPSKRPFHTIIPAILKEKNGCLMPFGVMGGQYQANGHARILSNLLDHKMDLQEALNFQRSFYFNGLLSLEEGYGNNILKNLINIGHRVVRPSKPIGGGQIVKYDASGHLIGASDPRKDGCALGF